MRNLIFISCLLLQFSVEAQTYLPVQSFIGFLSSSNVIMTDTAIDNSFVPAGYLAPYQPTDYSITNMNIIAGGPTFSMALRVGGVDYHGGNTVVYSNNAGFQVYDYLISDFANRKIRNITYGGFIYLPVFTNNAGTFDYFVAFSSSGNFGVLQGVAPDFIGLECSPPPTNSHNYQVTAAGWRGWTLGIDYTNNFAVARLYSTNGVLLFTQSNHLNYANDYASQILIGNNESGKDGTHNVMFSGMFTETNTAVATGFNPFVPAPPVWQVGTLTVNMISTP